MGWNITTHRDTLRHYLKTFRQLPVWQLLVLLLLSTIVTATLLRVNNLGMMERRDAVIEADEKGDAAEIVKTITELQRYVTRHMNTSLGGGFYLSHSYDRAREAAMNAAADVSNPNSAVYRQASIDCQPAAERVKYGGYVPCVLAKVNVGGQENPTSTLKLPRSEAYKVDFASPLWSFDLAGIFVFLCVLIITVIVIRLIGVVVLKILLRRQFSEVL